MVSDRAGAPAAGGLANGAGREPIEILSYVPRPWRGEGPEPEDWNKKPRASEWSILPDGRLFRMVYLPAGMSMEEARRFLDGESSQGFGNAA